MARKWGVPVVINVGGCDPARNNGLPFHHLDGNRIQALWGVIALHQASAFGAHSALQEETYAACPMRGMSPAIDADPGGPSHSHRPA